MVEVRVLVSASGLPVLLQMLLRVLEMVCASGVAASYRAFLEVALQNVTSAKRVLAQMALVRALAGVWRGQGILAAGCDWKKEKKACRLTAQQMALEMFQVQVRLVAMRTLILALGVLGRSRRRLASGGRGPARVRGQDSAAALLANDVDWLGLLVG